MLDPGPSEIPIFELPLAIVPLERVPLHIFEERYKRMLDYCLSEERPFGLVYRDDEGGREIGCTARVAEVLKRHDDGRLDIVVRGEEVFRVLERYEAEDWPAGSVEAIEPGHEDGGETPAVELEAARQAFAELLDAVGAEPDRAHAASGSYEIAAQVEMPPEQKQRLLEERSERVRLTALERSLRTLLGGVERSREFAERARTNGHGPPPRRPG